jgi:hypothetical protein
VPADADGRFKAVEGELSLLKNQIQQTLLDIREHVLELTNPFGSASRRDWGAGPGAAQDSPPVVATVLAPPADPEPPATPPPPEPEPEPEPEPAAQASPALESFDALFDAPAAPGMEGPAGPVPENAWDAAPAAPQEPAPAQTSAKETHETRPSAPAAEPKMETGTRVDLITLTSMVKWVDQTTRRIGKERVAVILDIYEMAGRIDATTKQMVQRLCALSTGTDDEAIPLRDVVSAMLQIDGLLDARQVDERRLLSLLIDDSFDPFQGLAATRNGSH